MLFFSSSRWTSTDIDYIQKHHNRPIHNVWCLFLSFTGGYVLESVCAVCSIIVALHLWRVPYCFVCGWTGRFVPRRLLGNICLITTPTHKSFCSVARAIEQCFNFRNHIVRRQNRMTAIKRWCTGNRGSRSSFQTTRQTPASHRCKMNDFNFQFFFLLYFQFSFQFVWRRTVNGDRLTESSSNQPFGMNHLFVLFCRRWTSVEIESLIILLPWFC